MDLAVLDPLPLFRLGVLAALGGGRELATAEELTAWLSPRRSTVVLMTLAGDDDEQAWSLLPALQQYPELRAVAVLASYTVVSAARALRAGAVHVVARDAAPATLRAVVNEVGEGVVRLSVDVLRAATTQRRPGRLTATPTDEELAWLRALADGRTMSFLATETGHSERVLYRRLKRLYRQLGVTGRTQALILGRDEGWL